MKNPFLLLIPAFICILFSACQKQNVTTPVVNNKTDSTPVTGGTYYLASIEERSDDSSFVNHTGFEYDNSGRITGFFATPAFEGDNNTFDKITYNGNEAVMILTIPPFPFPGIHSADTVWFTMGNDNKALKRIHYHFDEDDGSSGTSSPWWQYIYDTTNYEYDAAGFIKREMLASKQININIVVGKPDTASSYGIKIKDYTVLNSNVVGRTSTWFSNNQTVEETITYEYNNAYPNNLLMTNPAVLMECNLFYGWPINPKNKNIPEKISNTTVYKDASGAVVNTTVSSNSLSFTYDANGHMATMTDPAFPANIKWYFTYGKQQ